MSNQFFKTMTRNLIGKPFSELVYRQIDTSNYFARLFAKTTSTRMHDLKFHRIQPFVLPLYEAPLPKETSGLHSWSVESIAKPLIDIRHFVPPHGHRVNETTYKKEAADGVKNEKMETLYDCRPLDASSPIKRLLIAAHKNAQVSLMVMPHEGVSEQVWQSLSMAQGSNIDSLNTPQTPNGQVFQFASEAGTDSRARAALVVKVDNDFDISRLQSFMAGIHRLTPFSQPLLNHCHDLLTRCKEIKVLSQQQTLDSWWQPEWQLPQSPMKEGFTRYPNHILDIVEDRSNLVHQPIDSLNFPTQIPDIHLAILNGDRQAVLAILARDKTAIYRRNPWGHLPIEVASAMQDKHIGADLFDTWQQLPDADKWAHSLFIRQANNLAHLEYQFISGEDEAKRRQRADNYLSQYLPEGSNALNLYRAVQSQDIAGFNALLEAPLKPWKALKRACLKKDLVSLRELVADLLPPSQALYAAALRGDGQGLQKAIEDYFPDIGALRDAIAEENWPQAAQLASQPVCRLWPALHSAIKEQNRDKAHALLRTLPDKWWNLKHDSSTRHFALQDELKRQLRPLASDNAIEHITHFLEPWYHLQSAIRREDFEQLRALMPQFTGKKKPTFISYLSPHHFDPKRVNELKRQVLEQVELPAHFDLVYAALKGDWHLATSYIDKALTEAHATIMKHGDYMQAKLRLNDALPKRSGLHLLAITATPPSKLAYFKTEQRALKQFSAQLHAINLDFLAQMDGQLAQMPPAMKALAFKKIYHEERYHEYCLEDLWRLFTRRCVVNEDSYHALALELDEFVEQIKQSMQQLSPTTSSHAEFAALDEHAARIKALKDSWQQAMQQCIQDYQAICRTRKAQTFEVYTTAQACLQLQSAIQSRDKSFRYSQFKPVREVLAKQKKQRPIWQGRELTGLRDGNETFEPIITRLTRSALLSFEHQDSWGYTPLLLAIIADNLAFAKAFISQGLYQDRVKIQTEAGWSQHYSLLDHAQSPAMVELLLRHFVDANQRTQLTLKPNDAIATRMRDYGHSLQMDFNQLTVIERLISGVWRPPHAADFLKQLLSYEKDYVVAGPYDKGVAKDIVTVLKQHNRRIAKKHAALKARPKACQIETEACYEQVAIHTEFSVQEQQGLKAYRSTIKQMADVSESEKIDLAHLFAERFKLRDEKADSYQARLDFFHQHVARDDNYFIDFYTDKKTNQLCGFFCFQIKSCTHPHFGDFKLFYASLAVCDEGAAKSGLASSSFKMMLVADKMAKKEGLPLKCYGRFGRPGIAYLLMPDKAKFSSKYAVPKSLVKFIAEEVVGNRLEANGSSMPPVISTVTRSHDTPQLLFYDHMLDDIHKAHPDASLPLVFDVDDEVYAQMQSRLNESSGIDAAHIDELSEQFEFMHSLRNRKTARL